MIQLKQWESDTCNCIIIFDADSGLIAQIVRSCKTHKDKVGDSFKGSQSQKYNSDLAVQANTNFPPTKDPILGINIISPEVQKLKDSKFLI